MTLSGNDTWGLKYGLLYFIFDVLSCIINEMSRIGLIKGIKIARGCPIISHCFFADDSVLFIQADLKMCRIVKNLLEMFCNASGQKINIHKSCLYFSRNTTAVVREEIGHIFQTSSTNLPGNYLGLPIIWGRSKKQALGFVVIESKAKFSKMATKIFV